MMGKKREGADDELNTWNLKTPHHVGDSLDVWITEIKCTEQRVKMEINTVLVAKSLYIHQGSCIQASASHLSGSCATFVQVMPLFFDENPSLFVACYFRCAEMNNFTVKCIKIND